MAERPSTGVEAAHLRPERECGRRQAARTSTTPEAGHYPSHLNNVPAVLHLAGGDPQGAEFCDGPGPGMALEQNSLPAADYDRAEHTENGTTKP